LGRYFDVILIEGEFGTGKPDEAVYRHVLERLGVVPKEAWMVGDHFEWDVAAPQRLGLRGIWVDREGVGLAPGVAERPHRIIRDSPEILDPEAKLLTHDLQSASRGGACRRGRGSAPAASPAHLNRRPAGGAQDEGAPLRRSAPPPPPPPAPVARVEVM